MNVHCALQIIIAIEHDNAKQITAFAFAFHSIQNNKLNLMNGNDGESGNQTNNSLSS